MFVQARYYMPELGRFVEEDRNKGNGFVQESLNYYRHCFNNPLMYVDRDGQIEHDVKRIFARSYSRGGGIDSYAATEALVMQVMTSGNPNDDVHTLGEIFLYDYLTRKLGLTADLEVKVTNQNEKYGFIDVLAISKDGTGIIYDIKSINEIKTKGSSAAISQVKDYYYSLICDNSKNVRNQYGIKKVKNPTEDTGFGSFQVPILKASNYDVVMTLSPLGNGIYVYQIDTYKKNGQRDKVQISQAAFKNMMIQNKAQQEAQQIIKDALDAATLTVVGLAATAIVATLIAFIAEATAATVPNLVAYLEAEISGLTCGSKVSVEAAKPALEKILLPIAEEIIRNLAA